MRDSFNPGVFFAEQQRAKNASDKPNNFSNLLGSKPINIKKENIKSGNRDNVDLSDLLGNGSRPNSASVQRPQSNSSFAQMTNVLVDIKELIQKLVDNTVGNNVNANAFDSVATNLNSILDAHLKRAQFIFDEQLDDLDFVRKENLTLMDFRKRAVDNALFRLEKYNKDADMRQYLLLKNMKNVANRYNMTVGSINVLTQTSNQIVSKNNKATPDVMAVLFLSSIHELLRHFALEFTSHTKGMKQEAFVKDVYDNMQLTLLQQMNASFLSVANNIAPLRILLKTMALMTIPIESMVKGFKALERAITRDQLKKDLVSKYSSKKTPEMRTADATSKLPTLMESQRSILLTIQEILQNSFAQDGQLLEQMTSTSYNYKETQDKSKRVYVEELGQFLTHDENLEYNKKKHSAIRKEVGSTLRGRLSRGSSNDRLADQIIRQSTINNRFGSDDALGQLVGSNATGQLGATRTGPIRRTPTSSSGSNFDKLEIAVLQTGIDVIKTLNLNHSEFMVLFKKQFNIQLASVNRNIRDFGKEQVKLLQELIDTVKSLKFKFLPTGELESYAQGGVLTNNQTKARSVKFAPKGPDTVPMVLPVGSGVIPKESVKANTSIKRLGTVVGESARSQKSFVDIVPAGHIGVMVSPGELIVSPKKVNANKKLVEKLILDGRKLQRGQSFDDINKEPRYLAIGKFVKDLDIKLAKGTQKVLGPVDKYVDNKLDRASLHNIIGPPRNKIIEDTILAKIRPDVLKQSIIDLFHNTSFVKDMAKKQVNSPITEMLSVVSEGMPLMGLVVRLIKDLSKAHEQPGKTVDNFKNNLTTLAKFEYGGMASTVPFGKQIGQSIYHMGNKAGYWREGGIPGGLSNNSYADVLPIITRAINESNLGKAVDPKNENSNFAQTKKALDASQVGLQAKDEMYRSTHERLAELKNRNLTPAVATGTNNNIPTPAELSPIVRPKKSWLAKVIDGLVQGGMLIGLGALLLPFIKPLLSSIFEKISEYMPSVVSDLFNNNFITTLALGAGAVLLGPAFIKGIAFSLGVNLFKIIKGVLWDLPKAILGFHDFGPRVWRKAIKPIFTGITDAIGLTFRKAGIEIGKIGIGASNIVKFIGTGIKQLVSPILSTVFNIIAWPFKKAGVGIVKLASSIGSGIMSLIGPRLAQLTGIIVNSVVGHIFSSIGGIFSGAGGVIKSLVSKLFTGGPGIFSKIFSFGLTKIVGGLFGFIIDGVFGAIDGYKEGGFMGMVSGAIKGIFTSSGVIGNAAKYGFAAATMSFPFFFGIPGFIVGAAIGSAVQFLFDNFDSIKAGASSLWDSVSGMFGDIWKYISSPFISFFTPIYDSIGVFTTEVGKFFSADNQILAFLNNLWGSISSPFVQFFDFIKTKIKEFEDGLMEKLTSLPLIGDSFKTSNQLFEEKLKQLEAINVELEEKNSQIDYVANKAKDLRTTAGPNSGWFGNAGTPEQKEAELWEKRLTERQADRDKLQVSSDNLKNELTTINTKTTISGMRQKGGPIDSGKTYIVGEGGPELLLNTQTGSYEFITGSQLLTAKSDGNIVPITSGSDTQNAIRYSLNTANVDSDLFKSTDSTSSATSENPFKLEKHPVTAFTDDLKNRGSEIASQLPQYFGSLVDGAMELGGKGLKGISDGNTQLTNWMTEKGISIDGGRMQDGLSKVMTNVQQTVSNADVVKESANAMENATVDRITNKHPMSRLFQLEDGRIFVEFADGQTFTVSSTFMPKVFNLLKSQLADKTLTEKVQASDTESIKKELADKVEKNQNELSTQLIGTMKGFVDKATGGLGQGLKSFSDINTAMMQWMNDKEIGLDGGKISNAVNQKILTNHEGLKNHIQQIKNDDTGKYPNKNKTIKELMEESQKRNDASNRVTTFANPSESRVAMTNYGPKATPDNASNQAAQEQVVKLANQVPSGSPSTQVPTGTMPTPTEPIGTNTPAPTTPKVFKPGPNPKDTYGNTGNPEVDKLIEDRAKQLISKITTTDPILKDYQVTKAWEQAAAEINTKIVKGEIKVDGITPKAAGQGGGKSKEEGNASDQAAKAALQGVFNEGMSKLGDIKTVNGASGAGGGGGGSPPGINAPTGTSSGPPTSVSGSNPGSNMSIGTPGTPPLTGTPSQQAAQQQLNPVFQAGMAAMPGLNTVGGGPGSNMPTGAPGGMPGIPGSGPGSSIPGTNTPISTKQPGMMKQVYDSFKNAGFSDNQSRALAAEVGRENDFNSNTIFGNHSDAANGAKNLGFFSWQGDRRAKLEQHLTSKGLMKDGKMIQNQESLNAMAEFTKQEMESGKFKGMDTFLANKDIDGETAAKVLGKKYIKWAYGQDVLKNGTKFDWRKHDNKRSNYYNQMGNYNNIDPNATATTGIPSVAGTPGTNMPTGTPGGIPGGLGTNMSTGASGAPGGMPTVAGQTNAPGGIPTVNNMPSGGSGGGLLSNANKYLGMSEGQNSDQLNKFTGVNTQKTPWCGAFVGGVLKESGYRVPKGHNLAKNYLNYGQDVGGLANAKPGDIAVFNRGGGGKGHVGIIQKIEGDKIYLLGGNQGKNGVVSVSARDINKPGSELVGIRRPGQDDITDPQKVAATEAQGGINPQAVADSTKNTTNETNSTITAQDTQGPPPGSQQQSATPTSMGGMFAQGMSQMGGLNTVNGGMGGAVNAMMGGGLGSAVSGGLGGALSGAMSGLMGGMMGGGYRSGGGQSRGGYNMPSGGQLMGGSGGMSSGTSNGPMGQVASGLSGSISSSKDAGVLKPELVGRLSQDLGITPEQASGIVGNLAHESGNFKYHQELNPKSGRGGIGWAQWTGPRRKAFEKFAAEKGLDLTSNEASYQFLKHELNTTEKASLDAVKKTRTAQESAQAFEGKFERAGVKHYASRFKHADDALAAYNKNPVSSTPQLASAPGGDPSQQNKPTTGATDPANADPSKQVDPAKQANPATWQPPSQQVAANTPSPTTGVNTPPVDPTTVQPTGQQVAANTPTTGIDNGIQIDEAALKQDMQNGNLPMFASAGQGVSDVTDITNSNAMVRGFDQSKSTAKGGPRDEGSDIVGNDGTRQQRMLPDLKTQAREEYMAKMGAPLGSNTPTGTESGLSHKQQVADRLAKENGMTVTYGSQQPTNTPTGTESGLSHKQQVADRLAKENGMTVTYGSQQPTNTPTGTESGPPSRDESTDVMGKDGKHQQRILPDLAKERKDQVMSNLGNRPDSKPVTSRQDYDKLSIEEKMRIGGPKSKPTNIPSTPPKVENSDQKRKEFMSGTQSTSTAPKPTNTPTNPVTTPKVENSDQKRKEFMSGTQSTSTAPKPTNTPTNPVTPPKVENSDQKRKEFMSGTQSTPTAPKPTNTPTNPVTTPKVENSDQKRKEFMSGGSRIKGANPNIDSMVPNKPSSNPVNQLTSIAPKKGDSFTSQIAPDAKPTGTTSGPPVKSDTSEKDLESAVNAGPKQHATANDAINSVFDDKSKPTGIDSGPPVKSDNLEKDLESSVNAGLTEGDKLEKDLASVVEAGKPITGTSDPVSKPSSGGGGSRKQSSGGGGQVSNEDISNTGSQQPQMSLQPQQPADMISSMLGNLFGMGNSMIGSGSNMGMGGMSNMRGMGGSMGGLFPSQNPFSVTPPLMPTMDSTGFDSQIALNPPQTQFDVQGATASTIQSNAETQAMQTDMMGASVGNAMASGGGSSAEPAGDPGVAAEGMLAPRHNSPQANAGASGMNRDDMNNVPVDPLGDDIANRLFSLLGPSFFHGSKNQAMESKQNNYIENVFQ